MTKSPLLAEHQVVIAGREYWLRCSVEQQTELQQAAALLNDKIAEVRQGAGHLSMEKSLVLAALHLSQMLVSQNSPELQQCRHRLNTLLSLLQPANRGAE